MSDNQLVPVPAALRKLNSLFNKIELAAAIESVATEDSRYIKLVSWLRGIDPVTGVHLSELDRTSIGRLCHQAGVTYKTVIEVYRNFKRSESVIEAARRLPGIIEGIAVDAESRLVTCGACEGAGKITIGEGDQTQQKMCIPCEGEGKVIRSGDPAARKQILEMMEMSGKGIGVMNITAPGSNIIASGSGDSLEETLRMASKKPVGGSGGSGSGGGNGGSGNDLGPTIEGGSGKVN